MAPAGAYNRQLLSLIDGIEGRGPKRWRVSPVSTSSRSTRIINSIWSSRS